MSSTGPSTIDPNITLASLMQDYEQVLGDYVNSNFRMSLRGELLETDMFIDASFATGIMSFSATRGPAYNNVQAANGRLIALYQLAMFMDTIELSWTGEDDKPYIQDDDFNHLDKEFLTILGLTVLHSRRELRKIIEEKTRTPKRTFCFTGHLESLTTASILKHFSPDLYIGRELKDVARQIDHVCNESCPISCSVFMMDCFQLRPYQRSEQTEHTILTGDRAYNVKAYRDSGIIANLYSLAENRQSYRIPEFEIRSFVKPFDAMAVHFPIERFQEESSSDCEGE
ncbi:hypothetical protein EG328_008338 [Venturia inaequalis]|uniref:SRR1-like domain-containing protein n=1 Tax=Venturia inaequalis TaxID=5025 RepID=A0A8H3V9Y6_VENIN|nr:hypothetical protein EG328_008338 [Venturia inaequalis]